MQSQKKLWFFPPDSQKPSSDENANAKSNLPRPNIFPLKLLKQTFFLLFNVLQ